MNTRTKNTNINYSLVNKYDIFDAVQKRISADENGSTVIVPHVCNNLNLFNAGFAKSVASHYPIVKENYHMFCKKSSFGQTQFVETAKNSKYGHKLIFANMIAQNGIKNPKNQRPLNYAALVYSMNSVKNYIKNFEKTNDAGRVEIHCPKFGCGLSGGDWRIVSELIRDIWFDVKSIYVYTL